MTKQLSVVQLRQLEDKLARLREMTSVELPADGWIRTLRQALGMSTEQLARRMGVTRQAVLQLELAERRKTATWTSLRKAADALDCDVVYAVVPRGSLNQVLLRQGRKQAERHLARVAHSMKLDAHMVGTAEQERQIEELASHLASMRSKALWASNIERVDSPPSPGPPKFHGRPTRVR
jgi:predicted DNA-binding mobile mystery protein A